MARSEPPDHERPAPQNVPPVKARQGLLGLPVLVVLVAALALAAIAWWGAELFGVAIEPPASEQVGSPAGAQQDQPAGPAPSQQP